MIFRGKNIIIFFRFFPETQMLIIIGSSLDRMVKRRFSNKQILCCCVNSDEDKVNSMDCSVIIYRFYVLWPVLNNGHLHFRSISPFSEQLPFNEISLRYKIYLFDTQLRQRLVLYTYVHIFLNILFLLFNFE